MSLPASPPQFCLFLDGLPLINRSLKGLYEYGASITKLTKVKRVTVLSLLIFHRFNNGSVENVLLVLLSSVKYTDGLVDIVELVVVVDEDEDLLTKFA
jgi:hypothetical protein